MVETLKNLINCYNKNLLKTPNLQIIEKTFSNEIITFPDEMIVDSTFYFSSFKNSCLTNIKFTNVSFESSFFEGCFLENCVFDNTILTSMECENCTLKNCLLINCNLNESSFTETIFDECQFQGLCLAEAWFESYHFIKTSFTDFNRAQVGSAILINSKFSNYNKSIEFKGDFYLGDILQPLNGINGMFSEFSILNS